LFHAHVDFKVFLDGEEVDFNQEKYDMRHPFAHLHLSNPEGDKIIHYEGEKLPIGFFFESLGMMLTEKCFTLDTEEEFCDNDSKRLRFFVNGEETSEFQNYLPNDIDRILVIYGTEEELQEQLESVSDFACIYSHKCPERTPNLPEGSELIF